MPRASQPTRSAWTPPRSSSRAQEVTEGCDRDEEAELHEAIRRSVSGFRSLGPALRSSLLVLWRGPGAPQCKRVALYHRVSTVDQDPTAARHDLRGAATARGYTIAMEVEETGSGARNDRPGLQEVMVAARCGRIGAVLVWKLDHFGRSTLDLLGNIRQLIDAGVRFESITQGLRIDPLRADPIAQLILTVLAGVAEFERSVIRERTMLGLERARRQGKRLGRPAQRQLDSAQIAALRAAGKSWRQVASALGCTTDAARRGLGEKGPFRRAAATRPSVEALPRGKHLRTDTPEREPRPA